MCYTTALSRPSVAAGSSAWHGSARPVRPPGVHSWVVLFLAGWLDIGRQRLQSVLHMVSWFACSYSNSYTWYTEQALTTLPCAQVLQTAHALLYHLFGTHSMGSRYFQDPGSLSCCQLPGNVAVSHAYHMPPLHMAMVSVHCCLLRSAAPSDYAPPFNH